MNNTLSLYHDARHNHLVVLRYGREIMRRPAPDSIHAAAIIEVIGERPEEATCIKLSALHALIGTHPSSRPGMHRILGVNVPQTLTLQKALALIGLADKKTPVDTPESDTITLYVDHNGDIRACAQHFGGGLLIDTKTLHYIVNKLN